jgi:hypothetical protein
MMGHVVCQEKMWNTFKDICQKSYRKIQFVRPRYKWRIIIIIAETEREIVAAQAQALHTKYYATKILNTQIANADFANNLMRQTT